MARMIPGRIRNDGVTLSEKGFVTFLEEKGPIIQAEVDGVAIDFSFDDNLVRCFCDMFQQKGYCAHLAAVEHALKNNDDAKELLNRVKVGSSELNRSLPVQKSFGRLFLEGLNVTTNSQVRYRLSAHASLNPVGTEIWWTLKINRLPDKRSYIIRDIKTFLSCIQKESCYQIGQNYFEALSLEQFDTSSQAVITFLDRIIPERSSLELSFLLPNQGRYLSISAGFFEEAYSLFSHLYDHEFSMGHRHYSDVYFKDLEASDAIYCTEVVSYNNHIDLTIEEISQILFFNNRYVWHEGVFYRLNRKQRKLLTAIRTLPLDNSNRRLIQFHLGDQDILAQALEEFKEMGSVVAPPHLSICDFEVSFFIDKESDWLVLQTVFDYGQSYQVKSMSDLEALPFISNRQHEQLVFDVLATYGFDGFYDHYPCNRSDKLYVFFTECLPRLKELGRVVLSDEVREIWQVEQPRISLQPSEGLLEVSFDFSHILDDDIKTAMKALTSEIPYFLSRSGRLIVFDEETQKVNHVLKRLRSNKSKDDSFLLTNLGAYQLSQAVTDRDLVHFSHEVAQMAYDLTHPQEFTITSSLLHERLRDYQKIGVQWLSMLDHYGFGGILADDMGLGKTLQTLTFLSDRLREDSKVLILAPSSLIYNWQDECQKFAPQLDVVVAYGSKQVRDDIIAQDHQITITSYHSFRQDFEHYQKKSYDYLILDEAQVIKNLQTKIAQQLRKFDAKRCFALTGTPIENKLLEIWSIFQIVLPGLLPNKQKFNQLSPKEVARRISPFVLRRKKEDVLSELPELLEIDYSNELADEQKVIYLAQLNQMRQHIASHTDEELRKGRIDILSGLMRLRQICDTPALFMPSYTGKSGKLESLYQLLEQVKDSGHRALIFSQFRGMLDLVAKELDALGITAFKMTGSTPANERQEMTKAFNDGQKDVFLISLKAGGVGLNLTGADTVILIDLWWNPAVEMQAIGRAHRMGQDRNVEVYRLITRGTIEEKILALQASKKHLISTVLEGDAMQSSLSLEDIKDILGMT